MRQTIVVGLATLAGLGSVTGLASPARSAGGLLTGTTQISFGCPGPVREGTPSCNPWRPLGHARFSVAVSPAGGNPAPGTARFVLPTRRVASRCAYALVATS